MVDQEADIHIQEKKDDDDLRQFKSGLDVQRLELVDQYKDQNEKLKSDLELELKVALRQCEDSNNTHLNELMKNHQVAF